MSISISTGCCFDLKLNRLESIHFLETYKNQIDGIELMFASPKYFEFILDKKSLDFLKSLKFVSIHMPFLDIIYDNNKETKK